MHRPQASTSPTISIHDPSKFTPTWREIKDYVYIRSHSHPFVDVDEGNKLLWSTVIKGCMDSRRSRCLLPGSRTELAQVTVKGLHGLKLRIADFYSALGYLITETDPYYFEADQNPNDTEMEAVHHRMLANYCSWIRIAATNYFVNEDSAPTTACVIYTTTHQRKVLPILAPTGGAPGAQPVLKPGSGRFRLNAAVFPNLSEYLKEEARKLQEKNLQGFMEGLTFTGLSPLAIQELGIHWGHCAETLALLYMLDPEVSVQYFLNGMAADVRSIHKLNGRYNRIKFVQEMLKPACTNCQTVIHSINDEMQIIAKQRNQRTGIGGPFIYLDRGSKMKKRLPEVRRCARQACRSIEQNIYATRHFACRHCRYIWYCSEDCRRKQWYESHYRNCLAFAVCSLPGCHQSAKKVCKFCSQVPDRIPTRYCDEVHQATHWPEHQPWCKNPKNTGLSPSLPTRLDGSY